MKKLFSTLVILFVAACSGIGQGGGSNTDVYAGYESSGKITSFNSSAIQIRQVDMINSLRAENGLPPVTLDAKLTAAALTHARDIANQNRAWNYGSDKSTPQDRIGRAGFLGLATGEMVAETYLGEFDVMALWNSHKITHEAILNPKATHVGIAYYMQQSGKVWWVTDFAQAGGTQTQ